MDQKNFYITTTTPYVNADPHIGFALEIVAADVVARYQRLLGKEVVFNTGTDEHGQKIYQNALDAGQEPQAYVDKYAAKFGDLKDLLGLSYTNFIRTTNDYHKKAAQEFWKRCYKNGDIYKKLYEVKYCIGCEMEKTDSELENGRCSLHPTKELEVRKEENYFFKFSKYQQPLLDLYQKNPQFVRPEGKFNEIKSFVEQGLQDFSISRLKEKMPWGVAVPGDPDHVMYVWFDALVNYIATLGWPEDETNFSNFWPGMQIAGKDNLRQQSAMWQAMLLSAGLPNSEGILINGFISIDGQKMSKSLGNVISPQELIGRYSLDGARYVLMNLGAVGPDMDVNWQKLDTTYTADLANGLGNLCSRVAKLAQKSELKNTTSTPELDSDYQELIDDYQIKDALSWIIELVSQADQYLSEQEPWKKSGEEQAKILLEVITQIRKISYHLQPFMPKTAQAVLDHFSQEKIDSLQPLFPRLD